MTKTKKPKVNQLAFMKSINANFEIIDEFIKVQNKFNKSQMAEMRRLFNYVVELDALIKQYVKQENPGRPDPDSICDKSLENTD